jgi:hypothetical protein
MMSERAAAGVLAATQGLGREQARQLLLTGAAGAGALAVQPPMTLMTRALVVHVPIGAFGGLPWIATVSGFVVLAAVATGAGLESDGSIRFDLEPAGAWREAVEGRWFHTGAGRHWFSWHPDRLTQ